MRPLGGRERQPRKPPCRASRAECCQERRESLSGPCHNFSIGRHLWFGPMRSPPQRGMAGQPIECCSGNSKTFACDYLGSSSYFRSCPVRCSPDATVKRKREFQEVVENRGP